MLRNTFCISILFHLQPLRYVLVPAATSSNQFQFVPATSSNHFIQQPLLPSKRTASCHSRRRYPYDSKVKQARLKLLLTSLASAWLQTLSKATASCHPRRRYASKSNAEQAHCELALTSSISARIQNRASPLRVATSVDDICISPKLSKPKCELPLASSVSA